jgi:hypothetical protein
MANASMGFTRVTVANSLKAVPDMGGVTSGFATPANYVSVGSLRSRLAAANGTYYTAAKLDQMTVNDMVFALRSIDDKTTICDYMPTSTA